MIIRILLPLTALLLPIGAASARPSRPSASAQGMVSAADPRAAAAGAEILRAGGSATDAAIAIMAALNVVEPLHSGLGGGGFMVASDAKGRLTTYDGREAAPAAADPHWFYVDLAVSRAFEIGPVKGELFLHVANLFDRDPPIVAYGPAGSAYAYASTNGNLYDTLGRVLRGGLRFELK